MKKVFLLCFLVGVTFQSVLSSPMDKMVFGGIAYNLNNRTSIIDAGNGREIKKQERPLQGLELSIGKRIPLLSLFRLQIPLIFEYGYSTDSIFSDSILLTNGLSKSIALNKSFYQVALSPELQFAIPITEKMGIFLLTGAGIHFVMLIEDEQTMEDNAIRINDDYMEKFSGIRFSYCAGAGIDFLLTRRMGLSVDYHFRYWHPVKGDIQRDLFPFEALPYKEKFLTNSLGLKILLRL
jgi:hypothetical protein